MAVAPEGDREGVGSQGGGIDSNRSLRIEPSTVSVTVAEGFAVHQPFQAFMTQPDGSEVDVTEQTTFTVADSRFGSFDAGTMRVTGGGAGPVRVMARADGETATGNVEVRVSHTEYSVGVPQDAARMFQLAITGTNCGAQIVYPTEGTTMMANVGRLDVHWNGGTGDLFEVRVKNRWTERVIYTRANGAAIGGTAWWPFATSKDRAIITMSAMQSAAPLTKCVAQTHTVRLSDTDVAGAVYFNETTGTGGTLMRHDLSDSTPAAAVFANDDSPAACIGCHAISRDGARMAMTLDGATGRGAVFDLAERRAMPMGSAMQRWSSATFSPSGDELLVVDGGVLKLFEVKSGRLARTFETAHVTGNPEISPDGEHVVTVEVPDGADWQFASAQIVVRPFSADAGTIGDAQVVVPLDGDMQSYYPSWSPDGEWIAVTRATGNSYANHSAEVFVVSADGSKGPYRISGGEGGSWARFLPFETKLDGEKMYYLSFTSTRAFGRQLEAGREQLWLAPFFPLHASEDSGPITGPAFRAPWQSITTNNHNAQWATGIVRAVDGTY
ncbi:MAG: TolB family protein [Kofleriaceae bacterium]